MLQQVVMVNRINIGNVTISSLYTPEKLVFNYKRPMNGVVLEADFAKKPSRNFLAAGAAGNLVMNTKGWFGYGQTILHSGEGSIGSISWENQYLVWANEKGIHAYDTTSSMRFGFLERGNSSSRADLFRCHISWKSKTEFLIGWGDLVQYVIIKDREKQDIVSGLPSKYLEVACQFKTGFIVSGLSALKDSIIILAYMGSVSDYDDADQLGAEARVKVNCLT